MGETQGINILLNLFFGPVVNAARGIAVQVQGAVSQFFSSFLTAVQPQITKSYAQGDLAYMHRLILTSSRFSFYLLLLVALPVFFETEFLLRLWLGQVPAHTVNFVRIMLLVCMCLTFSQPVITAVHATGRIRRFQAIEGTMLLSIVPIAYLLLRFAHISPEGVFYTFLAVEVVTQFVRVWIVFPMVQLRKRAYFTHILYPVAKVTAAAWILPFAVQSLLPASGLLPADSWGRAVAVCAACLVSTATCIYVLGLSLSEREKLRSKAHQALKRLHRKG